VDDDFLLLLNACHDEIAFVLPSFRPRVRWRRLVDTSSGEIISADKRYASGSIYPLSGRSLVLLRQTRIAK